MHELVALVQFPEISEEIRSHFVALDSCLNFFSYATNVVQMQWINMFEAVQRRELAELECIYALIQGINIKSNIADQSQDDIVAITTQALELLRKTMDEKVTASTTIVATYVDAQQLVQTICIVTNMQLPTNLLVGRQCVLDANVPIKIGVTCDIYSASFLTNEKVAKKVYRIGMSEKEHVERYAQRFLREAKLWATFRSDYTLPFDGIGMEASEGDEHFQLYMASPLMKNFDAVKRTL
ncbi:hypothetical protein FRC07_005685 [Ceratobasidium sp. 392]|nr:hypothetical protein FRC07_005685 [Ceratobasidium sp. 392]